MPPHRVITDGSSLREAPGEAGGEEPRLGKLTDLILAREQRVVAPRERVGFLVEAQVLDDPRYLGVFIGEGAHGDIEERFSADIELLASEEWGVQLDEAPCQGHDRSRTASILA